MNGFPYIFEWILMFDIFNACDFIGKLNTIENAVSDVLFIYRK